MPFEDDIDSDVAILQNMRAQEANHWKYEQVRLLLNQLLTREISKFRKAKMIRALYSVHLE
jgi:hypothetical protein